MSDELLAELGRAARKRMREAEQTALAAGVDFRPVGEADGIRVGDVVSIGHGESRYEVRRIDPRLSDMFDAGSGLVYMAAVRGLTGPFKGRVRRIRTTWLRVV
jgi:hypothetical protein